MTQPIPFYLSTFESQTPRHYASQERILDFLQNRDTGLSPKFYSRYGVKSEHINQRFFECPDIFLPPEEMLLYGANGSDIHKRALFYSSRADEVFNTFYSSETHPPDHLIHVTCTGYISPSAPQKWIASKQWQTEVTHAYHMGCYASLPAVRMAWGLSALGKEVDLVHNEMCSLHLNPVDHTADQIVVQTLFADGHIKYKASQKLPHTGFLVRRIKEKVLPQSGGDMTWLPAPWGMKMTLSKNVPLIIGEHIRDFTKNLIQESGLSLSTVLREGIFALHPGGPRIIDTLAEILELKEEQIKFSRQILFERGNMSSATLPHIWERILQNKPKKGTPVVSFGFGPGLTLIGSVFEAC